MLYPYTEKAARGELDSWSELPQSRLALIIVLDQFSRTILYIKELPKHLHRT
ncbi:MAG: DUF924 domain-containing protein [Calothrix sp. FI2-JRJ7]|nr:DUF924 domain-containing protein [Calothrix sp. FI2-JRJ7]